MKSTPKTKRSAKLQKANQQSCHSLGIGRLNLPTKANAMERMMRKVWSFIV